MSLWQSQVPRHRTKRRPTPTGPPPIPSDTPSVLSRPQAATTDSPRPKPRTPHFQLGTVTPLGLAPRPHRPTHAALSAAPDPMRLAHGAHPPGARFHTSEAPLKTGEAPLTSGGTPPTTAHARQSMAHAPHTHAGARTLEPRTQVQTPCAPAWSSPCSPACCSRHICA